MQLREVEDIFSEGKSISDSIEVLVGDILTNQSKSQKPPKDDNLSCSHFEVPESKPSRPITEHCSVYAFSESSGFQPEPNLIETASCSEKRCIPNSVATESASEDSNLESMNNSASERFKSKVTRSNLTVNKGKNSKAKLAMKTGSTYYVAKSELSDNILLHGVANCGSGYDSRRTFLNRCYRIQIKYIRRTKTQLMDSLDHEEKISKNTELGQGFQAGYKRLKYDSTNREINQADYQKVSESLASEILITLTENQTTPTKTSSKKSWQNIKFPSGQINDHNPKREQIARMPPKNYFKVYKPHRKMKNVPELSLRSGSLSEAPCTIWLERRKSSFMSEATASPECNNEHPELNNKRQSSVYVTCSNHRHEHIRLEDDDPFYNTDYRELIDLDYLNTRQKKMTRMSRAILFDWMMGASVEFELTRQVVCLAMSYADRYFSNTDNLEKSELHLIGLTCLSLAIKAEEPVQWRLNNIVEVTGNKFTPKEVSDLELKIWKAIGWRLNVPTIESILYHYLVKWDDFVTNNRATSTTEYQVKFFEENQEAYRRFSQLTIILDIAKLHVDILQFDPRSLVLSLIYIVVGSESGQFDKVNIVSRLEDFSFEQVSDFNRYYTAFYKTALPSCKLELQPTLKFLSKIYNLAPDPDAFDESNLKNTKERYKDRLILQIHRKELLEIAKKLLTQ